MRARKLAIAATAALALGIAGSADAAGISLALDPSNTGPYNQIDESTYYIPRSSHSELQAVVLDDAGKPGNTCFTALRRTLRAPDFAPESGISCPSDDGDGGRWHWDVHVNETEQFKIAGRADGNNAAAESNVITLLTAPEFSWAMGYRRNAQVMSVIVQGDSDRYDGKLDVRQGSRLVTSRHISGRSAQVDVKVVPKAKARRCRSCLAGRSAFTMTLTPGDRSRWVTMTAKGFAAQNKQGNAGPVL